MLMWSFENDKMGTLTVLTDEGERELNLYRGNALMIALAEWTEDNGENLYSMHTFFCDKDHLKNCLGLTKGYDKLWQFSTWERIRLDVNKFPKECMTIADLLVKGKVDCTIELYR